jgi:hypothetical protein
MKRAYPRRRKYDDYPFEASERGLGQQLTLIPIKIDGVSLPIVRRHRFHPTRNWEFDFAIVDHGMKIAIEYEGGIYFHQGHTRPVRFRGDMQKYNEATILGWHILRFGPDETRTGDARLTVERMAKSLQLC